MKKRILSIILAISLFISTLAAVTTLTSSAETVKVSVWDGTTSVIQGGGSVVSNTKNADGSVTFVTGGTLSQQYQYQFAISSFDKAKIEAAGGKVKFAFTVNNAEKKDGTQDTGELKIQGLAGGKDFSWFSRSVDTKVYDLDMSAQNWSSSYNAVVFQNYSNGYGLKNVSVTIMFYVEVEATAETTTAPETEEETEEPTTEGPSVIYQAEGVKYVAENATAKAASGCAAITDKPAEDASLTFTVKGLNNGTYDLTVYARTNDTRTNWNVTANGKDCGVLNFAVAFEGSKPYPVGEITVTDGTATIVFDKPEFTDASTTGIYIDKFKFVATNGTELRTHKAPEEYVAGAYYSKYANLHYAKAEGWYSGAKPIGDASSYIAVDPKGVFTYNVPAGVMSAQQVYANYSQDGSENARMTAAVEAAQAGSGCLMFDLTVNEAKDKNGKDTTVGFKYENLAGCSLSDSQMVALAAGTTKRILIDVSNSDPKSFKKNNFRMYFKNNNDWNGGLTVLNVTATPIVVAVDGDAPVETTTEAEPETTEPETTAPVEVEKKAFYNFKPTNTGDTFKTEGWIASESYWGPTADLTVECQKDGSVIYSTAEAKANFYSQINTDWKNVPSVAGKEVFMDFTNNLNVAVKVLLQYDGDNAVIIAAGETKTLQVIKTSETGVLNILIQNNGGTVPVQADSFQISALYTLESVVPVTTVPETTVPVAEPESTEPETTTEAVFEKTNPVSDAEFTLVDENTADDAFVVALDDVSGEVGDTVEFSASVKNNPGLFAATIKLKYDSDVLRPVLKDTDSGLVVDTTVGEVLPGVTSGPVSEVKDDEGNELGYQVITFIMENTGMTDVKADGVLFTFQFEIIGEPAYGDTTNVVFANVEDTVFSNLDGVLEPAFAEGSVTVEDGKSTTDVSTTVASSSITTKNTGTTKPTPVSDDVFKWTAFGRHYGNGEWPQTVTFTDGGYFTIEDTGRFQRQYQLYYPITSQEDKDAILDMIKKACSDYDGCLGIDVSVFNNANTNWTTIEENMSVNCHITLMFKAKDMDPSLDDDDRVITDKWHAQGWFSPDGQSRPLVLSVDDYANWYSDPEYYSDFEVTGIYLNFMNYACNAVKDKAIEYNGITVKPGTAGIGFTKLSYSPLYINGDETPEVGNDIGNGYEFIPNENREQIMNPKNGRVLDKYPGTFIIDGVSYLQNNDGTQIDGPLGNGADIVRTAVTPPNTSDSTISTTIKAPTTTVNTTNNTTGSTTKPTPVSDNVFKWTAFGRHWGWGTWPQEVTYTDGGYFTIEDTGRFQRQYQLYYPITAQEDKDAILDMIKTACSDYEGNLKVDIKVFNNCNTNWTAIEENTSVNCHVTLAFKAKDLDPMLDDDDRMISDKWNAQGWFAPDGVSRPLVLSVDDYDSWYSDPEYYSDFEVTGFYLNFMNYACNAVKDEPIEYEGATIKPGTGGLGFTKLSYSPLYIDGDETPEVGNDIGKGYEFIPNENREQITNPKNGKLLDKYPGTFIIDGKSYLQNDDGTWIDGPLGNGADIVRTAIVPPTTEETEHKYVLHDGVPAYCDKAGMQKYYTCENCNKIFDKNYNETTLEKLVIPAIGHKVEIMKGKPATCTEDGLTDGNMCSVCGEILVEQKVIPAIGHKAEIIKGKSATCTEDGLTDGNICSVCGDTIVEQKVIPAIGHKIEIIKGKPATCTEDGVTDGEKCSVCGEILVEQQVISAAGHKYVLHDGVPAYCETTGTQKYYTCENCNKIFDKNYNETLIDRLVIPALGHKIEITKGKPATCTEDGLTDGNMCSVCGEVLVEQIVIPATGHKMTFVDEVPATNDSTGVKSHYVCSECEKLFDLDKNEISADELVIPKLIKPFVYGDTNGDGKINLLDLISVRKYLAKWNIELNTEAIDCNADGKVNLLDLILLRKYLAKWNVVLGPQA